MPRARSERGAVLPMVAIMLTVLMATGAFAVDLGMQRVARRDMQSLADAVALDVARLLDGGTAGQVLSGAEGRQALSDAAAESAARNDDRTLGEAPSVTAVLVRLDAAGAPVLVGDVPAPVPAGDVPDGVLVTARTSVDYGFAGGRGGAVCTALATADPFACFRLGSYAVAVDPGNAADTGSDRLNELLEDAFQVNGLGYHGLADSSVSLGGLATGLGVATPDGLASLQGVRLGDLFSVTADVLEREGGSVADVWLLRTLAASAQAELDATVDVADLLSVSSSGGAVLASTVSVLDLVAASAFAADGTHALSVPVLWSVPRFSAGATSLDVIEAPRQACGDIGVTAETAQLAFTAEPVLHVGTIAGLTGDDVAARLDVQLAGATGRLTSVTCGDATPTSPEAVTVDVTRRLSRASLSIPLHVHGDLKAVDLGLDLGPFGLPIVIGQPKVRLDLTVQAGVEVMGNTGTHAPTYAVPNHTYAEPEPVGDASAAALPMAQVTASDVTGTVTFNSVTMDVSQLLEHGAINLAAVLAAVNSQVIGTAVNPFIAQINAVLTPTAGLLGLHVNGVDLHGVPRPACSTPGLRG